MASLAACIGHLVKKHGSLRKAADAAGVDVGYLSRLRSGAKDQPSDRMLKALGIERVTAYKLSKKSPEPFARLSPEDAAAYHGIDND